MVGNSCATPKAQKGKSLGLLRIDNHLSHIILHYITNNQIKLRVDSYVHLMDAVGRHDADFSNIGQMIVLPSSFTGGPHYMHEHTQDAMTYVRHYGRPDLSL